MYLNIYVYRIAIRSSEFPVRNGQQKSLLNKSSSLHAVLFSTILSNFWDQREARGKSSGPPSSEVKDMLNAITKGAGALSGSAARVQSVESVEVTGLSLDAPRSKSISNGCDFLVSKVMEKTQDAIPRLWSDLKAPVL